MIDAAAAAPPELEFGVEAVRPLPSAATPTLRVALQIDAAGRDLRGLGLAVRVQIHAQRRRYNEDETERLVELFGPPEQWARSLGPVPWISTALNVGPFSGQTTVALDLPCTYDFEVSAAKYLAGLDGGTVPLELLFSGTMLWLGPGGRLQTALIPWDREAELALPVAVWQQAVRACFGDSAWLRVHRDVFARLQAFRSARGLTSWEGTLEELLEASDS